MTLKDIWWYRMLVNFIGHVTMSDAFLADIVDRIWLVYLYNSCDTALFCALYDQLTSLDRHAQVTFRFAAVAELLVHILMLFSDHLLYMF